MGSMLRSDLMTQCDIYIQPEAAFDIISQLGDLGCVQFKDMTPDVNAFQRNYVAEVRRCSELERKLRYMKDEMAKYRIYTVPLLGEPPAMHPNEIMMYENLLEKYEEDIIEMEANQTMLMKNHGELAEMYYILRNIESMLGDVELRRESMRKAAGDIVFSGHLNFKTGVVTRKKCYKFEMMIWRIGHGNIYFRTAFQDKIFEDPITGVQVRKVAFLSVCQGEELSARLEKVCHGFRVNLYACPSTADERLDMTGKLKARLADMEQVLRKTSYHRGKALQNIGRQYHSWAVQIRKAKAIYHTMNLFNMDITSKCLIGQGWIPTSDVATVENILEKTSEQNGTNVYSFVVAIQTNETPPTFHRTNRFTHGFQALINAYGDSQYRELNPGLYTIITFPFLFAVMFGDMGHGLIMLSFAAWMVANEQKFMKQKSNNEIWNIFFGGRYVILLMSLFTMYTGFVYNDIFSKPFIFTKSYWKNSYSKSFIESNQFVTLDPAGPTNYPYPFGVDPTWKLATNKIMLDNSIKMKLSIILGVIHMMFGLFVKLFNHVYFKHYHLIVLEFLPELLFLSCLFLWLVLLVFFKWVKYSAKHAELDLKPGCAPSILILFIDMTLMRATTVQDPNCIAYMFEGQETVQKALLFVALLMVPLLLLGTPIYKIVMMKKRRKRNQQNSGKASKGKPHAKKTKDKMELKALKEKAKMKEQEKKMREKREKEMLKKTAKGKHKEKKEGKISPKKTQTSPKTPRVFRSHIEAQAKGRHTSGSDTEEDKELHGARTVWASIDHEQNLLDNQNLTPKAVARRSITEKEDEVKVETSEETIGEIMITQSVHTIEFVLSTISHTASYLRLWALSLAHAQLSEMLWTMVLARIALRDTSMGVGSIKVFIVFGIWASFSMAILVVMEGLSAFLHTLRLHWVEFMSKFYSGGGIVFRPFNFKDVINEEDLTTHSHHSQVKR